MDCPEDNDVQGMRLGSGATYRIEQVEDGVIIHASGKNRTSGWKNLLSRSMLRIYPQQFEFHQKQPEGASGQAIMPYEVCLKWKTTERFDKLIITDADGRHEVNVESRK